MANKITRTQMYDAIIALIDNATTELFDGVTNADVREICVRQNEIIANKSTKTSATKVANQQSEDAFIKGLLTTTPQTVSEIISSNGLNLSEWSVSKVTSVLSRLRGQGVVLNSKVGKKSVYTIAEN